MGSGRISEVHFASVVPMAEIDGGEEEDNEHMPIHTHMEGESSYGEKGVEKKEAGQKTSKKGEGMGCIGKSEIWRK